MKGREEELQSSIEALMVRQGDGLAISDDTQALIVSGVSENTLRSIGSGLVRLKWGAMARKEYPPSIPPASRGDGTRRGRDYHTDVGGAKPRHCTIASGTRSNPVSLKFAKPAGGGSR